MICKFCNIPMNSDMFSGNLLQHFSCSICKIYLIQNQDIIHSITFFHTINDQNYVLTISYLTNNTYLKINYSTYTEKIRNIKISPKINDLQQAYQIIQSLLNMKAFI